MIQRLNYRFQYQPGKVMRAARRTAGLTTDQVAASLHVSVAHCLEMEKAVRAPTPAQWFLFCELVKIPEDSYFEGYNKKQHQITLGLPEMQMHYSRIERVGRWIKENSFGRLKKSSAAKIEGDEKSPLPKAVGGEMGIDEEACPVREPSES